MPPQSSRSGESSEPTDRPQEAASPAATDTPVDDRPPKALEKVEAEFMYPKALRLDQITSPENLSHIVPIVFSWDYLPELPQFLVAKDWSVELPIRKNRAAVDPSWHNSIPINPKAAGLPYHTGLTCARHNRHWRSALEYATQLYELLAADQSYNNARRTRGGTLADISRRELKKPEGERFVVFAINLFPQADEERMALIAAGILLVVIFDDSWEEAAGEELKRVQDDFVARMRGHQALQEAESTPLQRRLNEIVQRCKECDAQTNTDGGLDFISAMLQWVMHGQPKSTFKTPREYLDYRWMDAANGWLIATCKFSIASPISLQDPLIQRITRLVGDHISIVNDLGSFEKELRAYQSRTTVVLINLVQVVRDSCGLSINDAKSAAYTLQLLNEQEIRKELESLKENDSLSVEHWRFIDTLMTMIAGNTFYTMTTSRYGGEAARI